MLCYRFCVSYILSNYKPLEKQKHETRYPYMTIYFKIQYSHNIFMRLKQMSDISSCHITFILHKILCRQFAAKKS